MEFVTKKDFSCVQLIEALIKKPGSDKPAPEALVITVMESPSCSSTASKQTVLTGKFGKKIKYEHVCVKQKKLLRVSVFPSSIKVQ